jgi:hypothetical protein
MVPFVLGKHRNMSVKPTRQRARIVRYESLDRIPIKPLNRELIGMSDEEAERRAAADPDAGAIPPGFWDQATVRPPPNKQQITLRLDPKSSAGSSAPARAISRAWAPCCGVT